jgi:hypothetical protein
VISASACLRALTTDRTGSCAPPGGVAEDQGSGARPGERCTPKEGAAVTLSP